MALPVDIFFPLSLHDPPAGALARVGAGEGVWPLYGGFAAAVPDEACQDVAGRPAQDGARIVACLSDRARVERIRADAAALVKDGARGLILDRPAAWWTLGPRACGFCPRCRESLGAHLVAAYGAHFVSFDAARVIGAPLIEKPAARPEEVPYGRDREVWRLKIATEAVASVVRRARDEARLANRPLWVGARFSEVGPAAIAQARHLDLCLYPSPLPSWQARTAVGVHELVRAAMGMRPASAVVAGSGALPPRDLLRTAALCAALGVDLCPDGPLGPEAASALAAFRGWLAAVRAEHRARAPVPEVTLLYSLESDLWSGGGHRAAFIAAAEALTALGVQYAVRTDLGRWGSEPLVLAGASALAEGEARRVRRKVEAGGAAIVVGPMGAVDEDGRTSPPPFSEPRPGATRKGDGQLYAIAPGAAPFPPHEALAAEFARALGLAFGKGRRAVALSGAGAMVARAYLDPERRLDVHLANLEDKPARGISVQLAATIAGASRKAFLFRPGSKEPEKIALQPQGFGVAGALPEIDTYALLTVPR